MDQVLKSAYPTGITEDSGNFYNARSLRFTGYDSDGNRTGVVLKMTGDIINRLRALLDEDIALHRCLPKAHNFCSECGERLRGGQ